MTNLVLAATMMLTLIGCGNQQNSSESKEAWDVANHPRIMEMPILRYEQISKQSSQKGQLKQAPWRDDYWPFYRKGIAYRYHTYSQFGSFAEQSANVKKDQNQILLSPAEKYDVFTEDQDFTVTKESWSRYEQYSRHYPNNLAAWRWMGICSGWAPASISEPAPGGNVLAVNEHGRETLFFEADIRALMSKAYDINAMSKNFRVIGSRCNMGRNQVAFDRHGRPADGLNARTNRPFWILRDYSATLGAIEVTEDIDNLQRRYWLVGREPIGRLEGHKELFMYQKREDVVDDIRDESVGRKADHMYSTTIRMYKSCRDLNAGVFHLALVHHVSDSSPDKGGFVLEINRFHEVWNYPVWGFKSELSQPRPVSEDPAETRLFRAPGTAFTVDVKTQVVYASGISPVAEYSDHVNLKLDWENLDKTDNNYSLRTYHYTLEFDANGFLLGGEWHENTREYLDVPDFLWRPEGTLTDYDRSGNPSILRYTLLNRLMKCSFQEPSETISVPSGSGHREYKAVRCPIDLSEAVADLAPLNVSSDETDDEETPEGSEDESDDEEENGEVDPEVEGEDPQESTSDDEVSED